MKKFLIAASLLASGASADQAQLKQTMLNDLGFVQNVFQAQYAPLEWKAEHFGWSLEDKINEAKNRVQDAETITVQDYQKILWDFVQSSKDYHVSVRFYSTEVATLPFSVMPVGDRYFLTYIDRSKLTPDSFPFQLGDELVTFGGRPTSEVVNDLSAQNGSNVPLTDQNLAAILLTKRSRTRAMNVPQGTVTIGVRHPGSTQVLTHQLIWEYTPERVRSNPPGQAPETAANRIAKREMIFPAYRDLFLKDKADNPFLIGAKQSFVPQMGTKVWEAPADNPFYAYIYLNAEEKLVGYIRIPSYVPQDADEAIAAFAEIIQRMEGTTKALVIDQINNPGGSVFYLYALVSMLSDQAMKTPLHRLTLTQDDVLEADELITQMQNIQSDAQAKEALGPTLSGFPVTQQVARFLLDYARNIVNDWNAGHHLSPPRYLYGVDQINPAAVHYTKPILLLTNSLDFSGGDFFPAILQDNNRVSILGTRTAGAGGYVTGVQYQNSLGVQDLRLTASIAKRVDDNPIENLGVTPDVIYQVSETDLLSNFSEYKAAIENRVRELISL